MSEALKVLNPFTVSFFENDYFFSQKPFYRMAPEFLFCNIIIFSEWDYQGALPLVLQSVPPHTFLQELGNFPSYPLVNLIIEKKSPASRSNRLIKRFLQGGCYDC